MNLERKRELLLKWKDSGVSLPKWWKENAEALDLPHLSTLYAWAKKLGFSTEPGAEKSDEPAENPDENGDSGDSPELYESVLDGDSQGSPEPTETPDEIGYSVDSSEPPETVLEDSQGSTENDDKPEEEVVIARDRIVQLVPSTVPEPAQPEKPVDGPKTGINTQTWIIIGGAVVLGIGAYMLVRKLVKRNEPKQEQNNNYASGGNPFGYITIDQF